MRRHDPGSARAAPGLDAPAISARDLRVARGGRPVIRGLDLTVPSGTCVALLGANGSGKSTLVRSLLGLLPLSRGEVHLFGQRLIDFDDRGRLGYVPQHSAAVSGVPASVGEVVATGRLPHRRPFVPARPSDRQAVREALRSVDLLHREKDRLSHLSGGQQQRVLIARALAGGADLLVLDEPSAGVDLRSQQSLAGTLATVRERGATVLLVAHELGPLADLVDRTVVLDHGRVVYDGAPREAAWQRETWHDHHPPRRVRDHLPEVASPLQAPHPREVDR